MPTPDPRPSHSPPRSSCEHDDGPTSKRRKVRKGTRSCWECRRRKMKCIFSAATDEVCVRCRRRGAKCVSQECPEEVSTPLDRNLQMGDRVTRVESILDQLVERITSGDGSTTAASQAATARGLLGQGALTPESIDLDTTRRPNPGQTSSVLREIEQGVVDCGKTSRKQDATQNQSVQVSAPNKKNERLSRILYQSLPSAKDRKVIAKACDGISTQFFRMYSTPYNIIHRSKHKSISDLFEKPKPDDHPVLLARHMLFLATLLQHLHPDFHDEVKELSGPPREMMIKLADTAISLVTSNDDVVGNTVEGLECIMMESLHRLHAGNLGKGLMAIRRGMTLAQLMGFHRPNTGRVRPRVLHPETEVHPQFIWFRFVFHERQLCLMLGLSQGNLDHGMASEAMLVGDTPMGRLERRHCVVSSRILERNQSESALDALALTQDLDDDMQAAAASPDLPNGWWPAQNLFPSEKHNVDSIFWEMRRLFNQLFHYNLLIQLHLPYMLLSSPSSPSPRAGEGIEANDEYKEFHLYSRTTCITSSREVLSRFILYHTFSKVTFCCRFIDFFSVMAAMTLLLAHLDEHHRCISSLLSNPDHTDGRDDRRWGKREKPRRRRHNNTLAHQRPSDRAMVERALECLEEVARLDASDIVSSQSIELLRRLLQIEAEAATTEAGMLDGRGGGQGPGGRTTVHRVEIFNVQQAGLGAANEEEGKEEEVNSEDGDRTVVRIYVPYFGIIKITWLQVLAARLADYEDDTGNFHRQQEESRELCDAGIVDTTQGRPTQSLPTPLSHMDVSQVSSSAMASSGQGGLQQQRTVDVASGGNETGNLAQQDWNLPSFAMQADDWKLDGVDMAFFDSLIGGGPGTGDGGGGYDDSWLDWPTWPSQQA